MAVVKNGAVNEKTAMGLYAHSVFGHMQNQTSVSGPTMTVLLKMVLPRQKIWARLRR